MHACMLCVAFPRHCVAKHKAQSSACPCPQHAAQPSPPGASGGSELPVLEQITDPLLAAEVPGAKGSSRENQRQSTVCIVGHSTTVLPSENVTSPSLLQTQGVLKDL